MILSSSISHVRVSLGRDSKPETAPDGSVSASRGSSLPSVCDCAFERVNKRKDCAALWKNKCSPFNKSGLKMMRVISLDLLQTLSKDGDWFFYSGAILRL